MVKGLGNGGIHDAMNTREKWLATKTLFDTVIEVARDVRAGKKRFAGSQSVWRRKSRSSATWKSPFAAMSYEISGKEIDSKNGVVEY